jgi:hypothetical protein
MNHPNATLPNVLTFMWCLWKSRNDHLFNRQQLHPAQIQHMANALNHNLELSNIEQVTNMNKNVQTNKIVLQDVQGNTQVTGSQLPLHGRTLKTDLMIKGTKVFSDAAWKTKKAPELSSVTGIGVFIQIQEIHRSGMIMIQASTPMAPSILQAEAEALLVAARIALALQLQGHTFLTDNSTLASSAATQSTSLEQVPWEIRRIIADYRNLIRYSTTAVYHIKRDINGVAHNCAHQALRQNLSQPIFSCSSSAHRSVDCPFLHAVQQMQMSNLVIHTMSMS